MGIVVASAVSPIVCSSILSIRLSIYAYSIVQWVAHDDVIKWKLFRRYCPFVRGLYQWPVNSPHKGQWRRALMYSLICVWTSGWANNGDSGDLRRYRAHHNVMRDLIRVKGYLGSCSIYRIYVIGGVWTWHLRRFRCIHHNQEIKLKHICIKTSWFSIFL